MDNELHKRIDELDRKFGELVRKPNKSQADMEEKERLRLERSSAIGEDEKLLLDELEEVGVKVSSIWDLVNSSEIDYREGIPILVEHLSKPYHEVTKEGIVRSLTVKEARGIACKAIIEEYHKTPKKEIKGVSGYRWTFGNAMAVVRTKEYVDEIISIVLDEENGESRDMFVVALSRIGGARAKVALEQLVNDKDENISKEAKKALKLKKFQKIDLNKT